MDESSLTIGGHIVRLNFNKPLQFDIDSFIGGSMSITGPLMSEIDGIPHATSSATTPAHPSL